MTGRSVVMAAYVVALAVHPSSAAAQSWADLDNGRAVISGIDIVVSDVFDLTRPVENTWLGRTANALHVRTRRGVIARELLFDAGDVVDAARIQETERNLRRYAFIREVRIVPEPESSGRVRARVEVLDAWNLDAGVSFGRTGGATTWGFNVNDVNLAGTGKALGFVHERNRERSTNEVAYADPQLLDSRWALRLRYANLSDGRSGLARLERPYYSVETPYSAGAVFSAVSYSLVGYHLGDPTFAIPARVNSTALYASRGFLRGQRTAFRLGATYRAQEYEYGPIDIVGSALPPPDTSRRRLRGVSITSAIVQDRPATFQNFASIGQTEDYNLGWSVSADTGYFARWLGSNRNAAFADVAAHKGWRTSSRGLVLIDANARGRNESRTWRNTLLHAGLTVYNRPFGWHTLAARLDIASLTRPDPESWLYLDSAAGLRGYVDHFLAGDRRIVVSFDDRLITNWDVLGVVRMGFVAYADAGAIRRFDTGRWSRTFADVGGGLRFGALKGARNNVLQVSIAVPLVRDEAGHGALVVLGNMLRF